MSLVPQFGMAELLLLGVLALVVVGPKDLPKLMRAVGQITGKVRRMADEFRVSFEQMAKEAEIEEMRQEIEELKKSNPATAMKSAFDDAEKSLADADKAATAPKTTGQD